MNSTITKFYKGNLYTLKLSDGKMISAKDEEGYKVFNPALLDNLSKLITL